MNTRLQQFLVPYRWGSDLPMTWPVHNGGALDNVLDHLRSQGGPQTKQIDERELWELFAGKARALQVTKM